MKQTQHQRLLQAFQDKQDLMVYEIMAPRPQGLGIAQYNARVKELRELGHPIINVKPGHFRYQVSRKETMPVDSNSAGYQKFQAVGKWLKGEGKRPEYTSFSLTELKRKQVTAKGWLEANPEHKNYAEAIRRYEAICDEIALLEGDWLK